VRGNLGEGLRNTALRLDQDGAVAAIINLRLTMSVVEIAPVLLRFPLVSVVPSRLDVLLGETGDSISPRRVDLLDTFSLLVTQFRRRDIWIYYTMCMYSGIEGHVVLNQHLYPVPLDNL
jgi:citrate lyase alpha subunit